MGQKFTSIKFDERMSAGKICRMMRKEGEAFNGCPCSLGTRKKKDARSDVPFYEISTISYGVTGGPL